MFVCLHGEDCKHFGMESKTNRLHASRAARDAVLLFERKTRRSHLACRLRAQSMDFLQQTSARRWTSWRAPQAGAGSFSPDTQQVLVTHTLTSSLLLPHRLSAPVADVIALVFFLLVIIRAGGTTSFFLMVSALDWETQGCWVQACWSL